MNEHADSPPAVHADADSPPAVHADDSVELECGHATRSAAIVVFSTGRRLYQCPEGCGLQDCRRLES